MRSCRMSGRATMLAVCLVAIVAQAATAADQAVVKVWNYNIHDKKYQQKMYKLFNERHPDIRIEYSSISNTVYEQTLQAAFVAKEPPDIFLPVGALSFDNLREKGLLLPLNNAAPNDVELKAWMAQFPDVLGKFRDGVSVFDGKVYTVDLAGELAYPGYNFFGNMTLLKEAGWSRLPATFTEVRQAAAKITQAGAGKYYGFAIGLRWNKAWNYFLQGTFAHAAGSRGTWGDSPDLKDGNYGYERPAFTSAMKVYTGMREDGSIFPGELTMEDEQAKMLFATNKAGLQCGYTWNPGNYLAYNPDVDFDIALSPTPDDGIRRGFYGNRYATGAASGYVVSSVAKYPRAVWEFIKFISSLEYQEGYVKGGFGVSYLPAANKKENYLIPQMYMLTLWTMDPTLRRQGPILSEEAKKVWKYYAGTYPTVQDTLNNVYLGKAGFDTLADLDKRLGVALDAAIKKAQDDGAKVTRSDFVFSDWDMSKDWEPPKKK